MIIIIEIYKDDRYVLPDFIDHLGKTHCNLNISISNKIYVLIYLEIREGKWN